MTSNTLFNRAEVAQRFKQGAWQGEKSPVHPLKAASGFPAEGGFLLKPTLKRVIAMSYPDQSASTKKGKTSGSEKRHRAGIVGIRVSAAERAELEEAAELAGLTLGSYVRDRVLSAPKTRAVRRPPVEKKLLAQLLGQLGKAGGNIHQIAKHMNFGSGVMHDELRTALTSFEEAAASIMEAMGRKRA